MPSQPDLRHLGEQLHTQLLAGTSPVVTSKIAEVFMPMVSRSLGKRFNNLHDSQLIDSSVIDALMDYFNNPERFDPARASLYTYLCLRGKKFLLDTLAQQKSRLDIEKIVEVHSAESVYKDEVDQETLLVQHEVNTQTMEQLSKVLRDPVDFKIVLLMMDGVRHTSCYADLLGISDLQVDEQTKIVKRSKDRLKKIIQRNYKREKRLS